MTDENMLSSIEELILFTRLPGVGAATYWQMLDRFPSIHSALQASPEALKPFLSQEALDTLALVRSQKSASMAVQQVQRDMDWLQKNDITLVDTDHTAYPELLREIKRTPPLLYVKGCPASLNFPQVAIVGSRKPTPAGRDTAQAFGSDLAKSGFTITSGLAMGIDAAAHEGAVKVKGRTIAVIGTGIDSVYPQRNSALASEIIANGGAIVSEFPLGTDPQPQNFPQRNRIVSGLSFGVVVVEAAVKSGSLISARYALQQNRELFAVPGSIHNPLSRGCHALIKEGAKLVETSQDIVDELGGFLSRQRDLLDIYKQPAENSLPKHDELIANDLEDDVLAKLDYSPTPIDALAERTKKPIGEVMSCLLTMELKGLVANLGAGYMRLR
ncbi:DNA-processing protein DprA [Saccharophagus degradans]|nr:DNA-processing protein DprA [Saccharophagus degradans]